jgi:hypothetical protein
MLRYERFLFASLFWKPTMAVLKRKAGDELTMENAIPDQCRKISEAIIQGHFIA